MMQWYPSETMKPQTKQHGSGFNAKHLTFTWKKVIYILELQIIKIHYEQNHFTMNIIFPLHQPREECDIIYSFLLGRKQWKAHLILSASLLYGTL